MKSRSLTCSYTEFEKEDRLENEISELIEYARKSARNAYAPYSGFRVGAEVKLKSGKIVTGANVENAAFPSGICAEQNALANSVSNNPGDVPVAIAIAAMKGDIYTEEPVTPCGNCRQVLAEEEMKNGTPVKLILSGSKKTLIIESSGDLLPLQFNLKKFRKDPL